MRTKSLSKVAQEGWQQLKVMRKLFHETFDKLQQGPTTAEHRRRGKRLRTSAAGGVADATSTKPQTKEDVQHDTRAREEVSRQELLITPNPGKLMHRLHKYVAPRSGCTNRTQSSPVCCGLPQQGANAHQR